MCKFSSRLTVRTHLSLFKFICLNAHLNPPSQELQVRRTWDPLQHPEWLVFEVEGQLQIRPTQHWIADHLINHPPDQPGAIDQLNMGEGKTRVILPMLALHWTKDRVQVVRFIGVL